MGIRVRAVGNVRGMQVGAMAGFYDPSSKHPDPDLRGGQGHRIRVGDVFEINSMSEFSDSKKQLPSGKRGWMELVDPATSPRTDEATKAAIPGQVPGQKRRVPAENAKDLAPEVPEQKEQMVAGPTGDQKAI